MKTDKIHFSGNDFMLSADEISDDLLSDLKDCGGPGDALPAVTYVLENYTITGDHKDCKAYLKSYGAWDDNELSDHYSNLERLVWMAGASLYENEDIYFSTYG